MSTPNQNPVFVATPNVQQAQVSAANTNFNGTGTLVSCWTTGANGSLLSKVVIEVPGTPVADTISLYWFDGTNTYLYQQLAVPSGNAPSASQLCYRAEYVPTTPEVYPSGWTLKASTYSGQITNVVVIGGNY